MRIFKTKSFNRWMKVSLLNDNSLNTAINEMIKGLYDANLGGNVFKKRIAVGNQGKRSSIRTIIAFKKHDRAFFMYGFAKNTRANITKNEEDALKSLAKIYFSYDDKQIHQAIKCGELIEV